MNRYMLVAVLELAFETFEIRDGKEIRSLLRERQVLGVCFHVSPTGGFLLVRGEASRHR